LNDEEFFRRLRILIGRRCRHLGYLCTLVEVLEREATVILRCEEALPPIQADQFGQPLRRAAETRQVPVLDDDGENLSAEILDLLTALEADAA
jgi:hypothetical protein